MKRLRDTSETTITGIVLELSTSEMKCIVDAYKLLTHEYDAEKQKQYARILSYSGGEGDTDRVAFVLANMDLLVEIIK